MVWTAGFEPAWSRSRSVCLAGLGYVQLAGKAGIEPASAGSKPAALPLSYFPSWSQRVESNHVPAPYESATSPRVVAVAGGESNRRGRRTPGYEPGQPPLLHPCDEHYTSLPARSRTWTTGFGDPCPHPARRGETPRQELNLDNRVRSPVPASGETRGWRPARDLNPCRWLEGPAS